MLWKIYFWILLILNFLGIVIIFVSSALTPGDLLGVVFAVIQVMIVYAYAFKKKFLKKQYWAVLFWVFIVLMADGLLALTLFPGGFLAMLLPSLGVSMEVGYGAQVFALLFLLPCVFASYKLAKLKVFSSK